ncbi:MAG: pitrilysin family protein [Alphaproteobacteria bacterium]
MLEDRAKFTMIIAIFLKGMIMLRIGKDFPGVQQEVTERQALPDSNVIHTATLSNGVRVAMQALPGEPITNIRVQIKAGSRHETEGQFPRGVVHYREHMGFKGVRDIQGEIFDAAKVVSAFGGNLNASTGFSRTCYSANVPAEGNAEAITAISAMVCRPVVDIDDTDRERLRIRSECMEDGLDPDSRLSDNLFLTAFDNHPAMHPILGTEETILSIQPSDIERFQRENYTGANTVIAITGDIDPVATLEQLKEQFTLPSGQKINDVAPPYIGGLSTVAERVRGTRIKLAFHYDGKDQDLRCTNVMLADLLTEDDNSLLYKEMCVKLGIYSVFCSNYASDNLLIISFKTFPETLGACLESLRDTLKGLRESVDPDLLAEKILASKSYEKSAMRSPERDANAMATALLHDGVVPAKDDFYHKYQAVTQERIKAAVEKLLQSPPTLVASGDVSTVPSYDKLCEMFALDKTPAAPALSCASVSTANVPQQG